MEIERLVELFIEDSNVCLVGLAILFIGGRAYLKLSRLIKPNVIEYLDKNPRKKN